MSQDPTGAWTFGDNPGLPLTSATFAYPVSVAVAVQFPSVDAQGLPTLGPSQTVGVFGFDPRAAGTGISTVLTRNPPNRAQWLSVPVALEGTGGLDGVSIAEALFPDIVGMIELAVTPGPPPSAQQMSVPLTLQEGKGSDGRAPDSATYQGDQFGFQDYQGDPVQQQLNGLFAFEAVDDISIVAAPGAATGWAIPAAQDEGTAINDQVINHCEKMLYRVASIDTPPTFLPTQALDYRNNRSSNYAALYYPWITISSPIDGTPLSVPPAAYMTGICPQRQQLRRHQGARQRGGALGRRLRVAHQQGAAGTAEPRGRQLPAVLPLGRGSWWCGGPGRSAMTPNGST